MMRIISRVGLLLALVLLSALVGAQAQVTKTNAAIFAGGCFWCVEEAFEKVPGVSSAVSGYIGGTVTNPTYQQVASKKTGHAEAVQVIYDPSKVSYAQLVDWFWKNIDPIDPDGQFCDKGSPYRSAIFYIGDEQKKIAEASKAAHGGSGRFKQPIATEITAAGHFYPAETEHQDYYKKNPNRYTFYKYSCGRAQRLEQIWGKPASPPGLTQ